jgi:hypothetical protein
MTDRRDQYICAALTGLCAGRDAATPKAFADDAVAFADAALAAAGEKEAGTIQPGHTCTVCPVFQDEIARLRAELDKRDGMVQIPTADWRELKAILADDECCCYTDYHKVSHKCGKCRIDEIVAKVEAGNG